MSEPTTQRRFAVHGLRHDYLNGVARIVMGPDDAIIIGASSVMNAYCRDLLSTPEGEAQLDKDKQYRMYGVPSLIVMGTDDLGNPLGSMTLVVDDSTCLVETFPDGTTVTRPVGWKP
jgi:hypothetical protein